MIKHVFLDIDDTIFDFPWSESHALRSAYAELGLPMTDEMYEHYHRINRRWWQVHERGEVARDVMLVERHREMFREFSLDADPVALEKAYRRNLGIGFQYMPHAEEVLHDLRPKYKLYIASNGVAQTQYSRLASANLMNFFDGLFISEEIGALKPEPAFFSYMFSKIPDFDPEEAIIVGDSLMSDILGGIRAGIKTVWCNIAGREGNPDVHPDYEIRDLRELKNIL